jgi:hypothetical protein
MRTIIKYIPVSFLWFAWLVLTSHLLIPHDHHLVESLANQEEPCPASQSDPLHHSGFPVHCHAFNDLTSEKAVTFILEDNIQYYDASFFNYSYTLFLDYPKPGTILFDFRKPFPELYLLETSSLRAPPELS